MSDGCRRSCWPSCVQNTSDQTCGLRLCSLSPQCCWWRNAAVASAAAAIAYEEGLAQRYVVIVTTSRSRKNVSNFKLKLPWSVLQQLSTWRWRRRDWLCTVGYAERSWILRGTLEAFNVAGVCTNLCYFSRQAGVAMHTPTAGEYTVFGAWSYTVLHSFVFGIATDSTGHR